MRPSLIVKTGVALLAVALPVNAGQIPVDALPLPNRVMNADVVVFGKVTAIEDKTVAGPNKREYQIAVITVSDALRAPKDAKTIRLGFVVIPPNVRINPQPFQAAVGMEGYFFLRNEGDFYVANGGLGFVSKQSANFEKDSALIKRSAKIMEAPNNFLKAESAEDRFIAAAMLLNQYRGRRSIDAKTEPIDADQSKLILKALATAEWPTAADYTKLNPRWVIARLGLTDKDGWNPPVKDQKAFADYSQKWLTDHAETYRIQKFVVEKGK
jgi:hypothetical protein